MDVATFFTRLLQTQKQTVKVTQPDDLAEFEASWAHIKETLLHPDERQLSRGIKSTDVPGRLKHLVDALIYESGQTDEDTTGVCLEYLLRNDVLSELEKLSENDRPSGIKGEVVRTINDLVVSLSERFLVHNAVHRPLRRLLRSCVGDGPEEKVDGVGRAYGAAGMDRTGLKGRMEDDTEEDLLDLMCTLASRMRAYPPLLLIFFHDKGWLASNPSNHPIDPNRALSPTPSTQTSVSHPSRSTKTPHFEFLLFSYLLRYAHREGKTGDLARAGLLFLFDIAFLTPAEEGGENLYLPTDKEGNDPLQEARDAFGEYILDGDFADVMAAGLGAIWSLLPSKLKVPTLSELARNEENEGGISASRSGGMHLGATLEEEEEEDELKLSTDTDVREQLDLLVKLLGFLQDIIHRCHSPLHHADPNETETSHTYVLGNAIAEATITAIYSSFIVNVIYPSILECSPNDGTSVAVMTYLEVISSKLGDGPLLDEILGTLMESDDDGGNDYYADEGRFTLKDLILDNIRSTSAESATAGFRLLNTLLSLHCDHGIRGLIRTVREYSTSGLSKRTKGNETQTSFLPRSATSCDVHLQEVELYGSLISRIDPTQSSPESSTGYTSYLTDAQSTIQADTCFANHQIPLQFLGEEEDDLVRVGEHDPDPCQHRMSPGDPLVSTLLELLGHFMCSSPDTNVALTGVLASLASCPNRSLAGWLVYEPPNEADPWSKEDTRSDSGSDVIVENRQSPKRDLGDPFTVREQVELPAVYQILRDLVRQVNRFRLDVDDFDRLLSERRQGLLFADHLDEAMNVLLDVEPSSFEVRPSPGRIESPVPKKSRPSLVGGLKSFLTPKRKISPATPNSGRSPATSTPLLRKAVSDIKHTSPFKAHYEQTTYFSLEAHTSSPIADGPWSPARMAMTHVDDTESAINENTKSVFEEDTQGARSEPRGPKKVTLSSVLDNCVILEEFLKEIVAVITARRALGIDQVGFVPS